MFLESRNKFRAIFLIITAFAGICWFFYSFATLDPLSTIKSDFNLEQASKKSNSTLRSWQNLPENLIHKTELKAQKNLIDSLQKAHGSKNFQKLLKDDQSKSFPLFYWQTESFISKNDRNQLSTVTFTPNGEIISFKLSNAALASVNPFNINAIKQTLGLNFDANFQNRAIQDSLINLLLNFQNMEGSADLDFSKISELAKKLGAENIGQSFEIYTQERIWEGADYFLDNSYWKNYSFNKDTLEFIEENGLRFVRLHLTSNDTILGYTPKLSIDLLPTGGIKAMSASFPVVSTKGERSNSFSIFFIQLALLAFGIWLISVFYLRIKANAIDTQPAFVVAILAGFLFAGSRILSILYDIDLTLEGLKSSIFSQDLFLIGILGAISSILFFVLTSVSDSVTRQHWPSKLKAWDLARRGFFKNKPLGRSLLCGITIAGILAGFWTVLVQLFPNAYVSSFTQLSALQVKFPSIFVSVENILGGLLIVLAVFMIIGNQLYALTSKKWIIPIVSGILFSHIIGPFMSIHIEPMSAQLAINFLIGLGFGIFYLNFGFLTLLISLFIFLGMFTTRTGWLFDNSPDANTFYFFISIVISSAVVGTYFLITGNERKDLPDYVPAYIEEQAKERRLEQELEIAHQVQQTFLPSRVEHMKGIDIAGICKPAQVTGGDYYDMISLGKNRMAIAIGDVSGKGIQAAFYMTFVKGVLHSLSALILSPVELLNQLNRLFNENATRGTFISMIYGIFEADKRMFTFARAGHNPIFVLRANGESEWLQPKGIGIGVAKSDLFRKVTSEVQLTLNEDDIAVLYTDGITEMLNISNQFYDEHRLEKVVRSNKNQSSINILNAIIDNVTEFKGVAKQHDDMTLVVIKADASVNN